MVSEEIYLILMELILVAIQLKSCKKKSSMGLFSKFNTVILKSYFCCEFNFDRESSIIRNLFK